MRIRLFQENGSLFISPKALNLYYSYKKFLKCFFLRTSGEYLTKCRQESVFKMNPVWKRNPCQYLVNYSPDVLKKRTKDLDIFTMDKKCFPKTDIKSIPQEIWINKQIRITEIYITNSNYAVLYYNEYITVKD